MSESGHYTTLYTTRGAAALAIAVALAAANLCAVPSSAAPAAGDVIAGRASVVDGDTIEVEGRRIRLEGIDAPELAQTCGDGSNGTWSCGKAAAKELAKLTSPQEISCESKGEDKYGRMLGVCFSGDLDINAEMVRRGYAWAFVKYTTTYADVEEHARTSKAGIWQGDAEPAWEFRKKKWDRVAETSQAGMPEGCAIKGNVSRNGKIYHMPWSEWYSRVTVEADRGERWFCSEDEAQAAGWRPARS